MSRRDAIFDQFRVAERAVSQRDFDDRRLAGRLRRSGRRVAPRPFGDRHVLLALHERGETRDVLALRRQASGIVAGVAAGVVRRDLDAAVADRRGPDEIDGEASEMRQALVGGGAFDRPADERRRRASVLMVGIPGPARERARAKKVRAEIDVGRIQGQGSSAHAPGVLGAAQPFALQPRRAQDRRRALTAP